MLKQHIAIIIPGLGDDSASSIKRIEMLTSHWIKNGITPLIHAVKWRDGEPFEPKLNRLLELIDSLIIENKVSLVGTSAGANMALNAFLERKEKVHKVVNVPTHMLGIGFSLKFSKQLLRFLAFDDICVKITS